MKTSAFILTLFFVFNLISKYSVSSLVCYVCAYDLSDGEDNTKQKECLRPIPPYKFAKLCEASDISANDPSVRMSCYNESTSNGGDLVSVHRFCGEIMISGNTRGGCDKDKKVRRCGCSSDGCNVPLNLYQEQVTSKDHIAKGERKYMNASTILIGSEIIMTICAYVSLRFWTNLYL